MNQGTANDPRDEWMAAVFRSRAGHSHVRSDCPNPERLWDAVRLQMGVEERLEVVDHISECPTCAEAWSLAWEVERALEATGQPQVDVFPLPATVMAAPSPPVSALYGRRALLIGVAAALLLALGIGFMVFRPAAHPTEDVAGTSPPRDQQAAAPSARDLRLRWTAGSAGSRYDVTVMTPDKDVVMEVQNLEVTEYRVPPERLTGLADDAALLWRVVARTPEGSTVSSDLLAFRLQETAPLATLASETDVASIRQIIAAYAHVIETKDSASLRAISLTTTPARFDALQTRLRPLLSPTPKPRLEDRPDVRIEVFAFRFKGRTAEAAIQAAIKWPHSSMLYLYGQILTFEKTDAGSWSLTAIREGILDKFNPSWPQ